MFNSFARKDKMMRLLREPTNRMKERIIQRAGKGPMETANPSGGL